MIKDEIKNIKSTDKDCRNFGLVVGGVLVALGGYGLWRKGGGNLFVGLAAAGALLMLLGLAVPKMLKPLQRPWMMLAVVMGYIMSHVVLTIFYYLVVTPVALVARMSGSKFLDVKWKDGRESYWERREDAIKNKTDYEKQY